MCGRPRRIKQKNVPSLQGAKGFVPHIRPRKPNDLLKIWSEWQDLNLRPPRPERGGPPENRSRNLTNH
jgi:hypothetical protein